MARVAVFAINLNERRAARQVFRSDKMAQATPRSRARHPVQMFIQTARLVEHTLVSRTLRIIRK
jgi:hypothetical protein